MKKPTTVRVIYEDMRNRVQLSWVAGRRGANRTIKRHEAASGGASLLGHLNLIHQNQVQIVGNAEMTYLGNLRQNSLADAYQQIFDGDANLIVFADDVKPLPAMITQADRHNVPMMQTPISSFDLVSEMRYYFSLKLAQQINAHGVFMEVMGMGVLITGEAGIGKSELALELVSRGHRLIADDMPLFSQIAPDIIRGNSPDMLQDFLEVRGLGLLDIRAMYGDSAIKKEKYLRLIINLIEAKDLSPATIERLSTQLDMLPILGVSIPQINMPVAPGRNLAVLVEAAARNHQLILNGYNASEVFIQRQKQQLDAQ